MSEIHIVGTPGVDFISYPKTPRLNREVIVTEKIDGTNAVIYIPLDAPTEIYAGSKNRWILPGKLDNAGFAAWVVANRDELLKLGPGYHHGEWWGKGIQKRYKIEERYFSLFNVSRWSDDEARPKCCQVVPTLWRGTFEELMIDLEERPKQYGMYWSQYEKILHGLRKRGSVAAPGNPAEGIVVFHTASGHIYKVLLENDDTPKGAVK